MRRQHASRQASENVTPDATSDVATLAWRRDLIELRFSPFWGHDAKEARRRWNMFVEEAVRYATYDDLPDDLKAIYQKAYRQSSPQHRIMGRVVPDVARPELSHDLVKLATSPFWRRRSKDVLERWDMFAEAAVRYATYDDLPDDLKAIYQKAYRQLHARS